MKKFMQFSGLVILMLMISAEIYCEEKYEDSMTLKFSDMSKPGLLKIYSGSGDITITGYSGKEVILKTVSKSENLLNPPEDEKSKGLKRITRNIFNVSTIEDENAIVINRSLSETEMNIQVPFNTSLIMGERNRFLLSSINIIMKSDDTKEKIPDVYKTPSVLTDSGPLSEGDIEIRDISGEMEINSIDANLNLQDISGEVVTNTIHGDILVTFKNFERKNPMYFSTVNGDIDVTFPSDIKANLILKSVEGDLYTDFDYEIYKATDNESQKAIFKSQQLSLENKMKDLEAQMKSMINGNFFTGLHGITDTVSMRINGGGAEINITTVDGNIYVRKGK